jgi:Predicted membrane protein (DUF2339)
MESIGILVGLVVLGIGIGLPVWAIVSIVLLKRRSADAERRNAQRWSDLNSKLGLLEKRFKEVQRGEPTLAVGVPGAPLQESTPETAIVPEKSAAEEVRLQASVSAPPVPPRIETASAVPKPVASAPATAVPIAQAAAIPATVLPSTVSASRDSFFSGSSAATHPSTASSQPTHPQGASSESGFHDGAAEPAKRSGQSGLDLEVKLGTNWLGKIGIASVVLGLTFLLERAVEHMGAPGRVLLGVVLSVAMIAVGFLYERNQRYRILARAFAAGGWALLFWLSYAVYHVAATRVIDSAETDFLLMLAAAAAIVWYSLRYRSQSTTGLALGLSYLTVGIHPTSVYSLGASVVLALTVVTIVLRMHWFALEVAAILATYFNHYLWVSPFVEAMGPHRVEFAGFRTSFALLAFYWLLFRLSYIYRRPANDVEEKFSTAAALLNGICLLGMLKYQSVHPEWTFWALMTIGWIELGLAALAATRRRAAFVVLATVGSALLVAAFPFRYADSQLSWFWLIVAEIFLLAGVFTREIVFRRVGAVTTFLVTVYMIFVTAPPYVGELADAAGADPLYATAALFAAGALVCYCNAYWVRARLPDLFAFEVDSGAMVVTGYVGGALALLAAWFAFPGLWTAVAWAALALALDLAGKRFKQRALVVQGNVVAVAAIARVATLNFSAGSAWHGISMRLITVAMTALLLYMDAALGGAAEQDSAQDENSVWSLLAAAHMWGASILLYVLAWYEFAPLNVAVAWAAGAVALLEIGLRKKMSFLVWQSYAALAAVFFRICVVNLQESYLQGPGANTGISLRLYTVLPIALAYFFADWRIRRTADSELNARLRPGAAVLPYLGTIAIVALLYFELPSAWVAAGWASTALALIALAYLLKRADFLYQSLGLAVLVGVRTVVWNFVQATVADVSFWQTRMAFVGVTIALLFAALPFAFAWRRVAKDGDAPGLEKRPEQVFFFAAFSLLTALVALEAASGHLTVAWGIEGVSIFLFALALGERSFRLAGLGLLLACVLKTFALDVWGMDSQSRWITLIVLGGALVLVSFLYTRYKEKLRRYL